MIKRTLEGSSLLKLVSLIRRDFALKENVPTKISQLVNDTQLGLNTDWNAIQNKPDTFPAATHSHDERYFNINGATDIASGSDFNGFTTPGTYWTSGGSSGSSVHASMANSPTGGSGGGFKLIVMKVGMEDGYLRQTVYMNNGSAYTRNRLADGSWTAWQTFGADTDTKVTNTLATTTKYYLTGTTSETTNTGTQVFDTGVYVSATAGNLYATTFNTGGNIVMGGTSGTSYLQLPSGIKLY